MRLYLSVTDNGVTLEYTQKIQFPPVTHQRRHGSLVATFILITGRNRTVPDWFEEILGFGRFLFGPFWSRKISFLKLILILFWNTLRGIVLCNWKDFWN